MDRKMVKKYFFLFFFIDCVVWGYIQSETIIVPHIAPPVTPVVSHSMTSVIATTKMPAFYTRSVQAPAITHHSTQFRSFGAGRGRVNKEWAKVRYGHQRGKSAKMKIEKKQDDDEE